MRTRLNEYKVERTNDNSGYIYVNRPTGFDINLVPQAIRLVINETKSYPLTHSMKKSYITGATSGEFVKDEITYNTQISIERTGAFSSEHFTGTDVFTVEVDWGELPEELAKESTLLLIEGTFVKVDFTEDGLPLTREGGMCPITDGTDVFDGDYDLYSSHETSYTVGTIIQCTADNEFDGSSNVYAFIKAGASNLGISSGNAVTGTFEFGTWKKDHYYRVAQIVEAPDLNNETTVHIFTYEELPASIVEGFDQTKEAVQAAKQAIKGSDAAATLTAIYAHLNGGGSLPADVQQQLTLILNYLGSPAAMECVGMTPQEVVDELEDIFDNMGLDIAPCSVDSDGNVTAPSES